MENLFEFYVTRCEQWNEKKLFDNVISYAESLVLAKRRASFLQKQNFRKGDVIGILGANSWEWCVTYMAITSAGMIVLPLDTNLSAEDYLGLIGFADARAIFATDDFSNKIPGNKFLDMSFSSNVDDESNFNPPSVSMTDPASFVCTSGTTGKPKLAILTHHNVIMTSIATSAYELYSEDHFLCVLPLFHVYAFVANFIGPFTIGCSFVFLRSLKGSEIIKTLTENSFTCFPAAPQLWELFLDAIINKVRNQSKLKYSIFLFFLRTGAFFRSVGLSCVPNKIFKPVRDIFGSKMRFLISGGAPLKKKYFNYYRSMGLIIVEGYGLTETTGPIMLSNDKKNIGKQFKPGTVGKVMPGNILKLKNTDHEGIGEVWLKGDSVCAGYYKNDQANRDAFDDEGFFNTGDIGRIDRDGDLFLTGRKKNTIVLDSGKNVYPDEIEAHLKQSVQIADVAVFGKKIHDRETVCAVIVPVSKGPDVFEEIRHVVNSLNGSLPSYKRVGKVALSIDPLPKNSARKTLMNEVKKLFDAGSYQTDDSSGPRFIMTLQAKNPQEERIVDFLKDHFGQDTLFANQSVFDLGLDSLGLIEMIVSIEENLGISVDETKMQSMSTLEEIVAYLVSCPERSEGSLDDAILRSEITTKINYFQNPINALALFVVNIASKIFWKFRVVHEDFLLTGNSIIAANHESYLDILWILASIPRKHRKNVFITGKHELSFLKFIFPGSPIIFIKRGGNVLPALKASADILRSGKSLIIFPEGTRSLDGSLGDFKNGAAYLSKNLGKKIIPVRIHGSFEINPKGKILPRLLTKAEGSLVAGTPLDPEGYQSVDELNKALKESIGKL